jgi:hypothetical protein
MLDQVVSNPLRFGQSKKATDDERARYHVSITSRHSSIILTGMQFVARVLHDKLLPEFWLRRSALFFQHERSRAQIQWSVRAGRKKSSRTRLVSHNPYCIATDTKTHSCQKRRITSFSVLSPPRRSLYTSACSRYREFSACLPILQTIKATSSAILTL